jgi:hypothetical protein
MRHMFVFVFSVRLLLQTSALVLLQLGDWRGLQPHLSSNRFAVKNGLLERWGRAGGFGDPATPPLQQQICRKTWVAGKVGWGSCLAIKII